MKIIEQATVAKSDKAKSEDCIVVTDDFVAVIDGSTSKSPTRISRWRSNGRYAMQLISKYIKQMAKDTSVEAFCRGVTGYVRSKYGKSQMERLALHPEERLTASCIVFSRMRRQIWMVGDCHCLVGNEYYSNAKPSEQAIAERRSGIAHAMIDGGEATVEQLLAHDTARERIVPLLIESMKGQNHDYAVIDGFPIPMEHVRVLTLDFERWQIVMASDGYPFLRPTLQESEEALARQRAADPLNITYMKTTKGFYTGFNSFDDRSYIRFEA